MAKGKDTDTRDSLTTGKIVADCNSPVAAMSIEHMIFTIRGVQVMVDRDLATLYGVETKRLNEQVRRNIERFPSHFRFQLTKNEVEEVVANCDHLLNIRYFPTLPYVFTEQGVAMLSAVLRSNAAVSVSIQIMDAFVAMRHFLASNAHIFQRLEVIEHHQLELSAHQSQTDHQIEEIFKRLDQESITPTQGIFYDGQVFEAYRFAADLIRSAKRSVVPIDNYIDDTVLTLLDKRGKGVTAQIYTKAITSQLALDIKKHNAQFAPITVSVFDKAHDRFLCIDDIVYHIGASLKDLGHRWFAFAKMEIAANDLLSNLH